MGLRGFISEFVDKISGVIDTVSDTISKAFSHIPELFPRQESIIQQVPVGFGVLDMDDFDIDPWVDWIKDIAS